MCSLHTYTSLQSISRSEDVNEPATTRDVSATGGDIDRGALLEAVRAVLAPLAQLAVARGVSYRDVEEAVKEAFIRAAREAHAGVPLHRAVSRVSAATGISRREVTRLLQPVARKVTGRASAVNELFARWISDPRFNPAIDGQAGPRKLPRLGRHPSFETLAESVSRDVRPRTLLEELCRLGMARINDDDTVELLRDSFVPEADEREMFAFLGENVGDHLSAAVSNVVSNGPRHLEQALFADELSLQSIEHMRPLIHGYWKSLLQALAPVLQDLIDKDRASGRPPDHRMRIGMYAYAAPMKDAASPTGDPDSTQETFPRKE